MRDPLYKVIGAIIKQRRKRLGMKQDTLAKQLAISRGSLANIEIGRQSILVHQLYRFAVALELTPNDLLPPAEAPSSREDLAATFPSGLKPKQQQQIARLIEDAHAETAAERNEPYARSSKH
jgi:transcriptional regulator with XRE-family HTH domain